MTLKWYLHDAATTDTGTLPATTATISATAMTTTPGTSGAPSLVNKSMDGTIGALQSSDVLTTVAVQTAQPQPIVRFCSAPLAAQTIASQQLTIVGATAESNTNSIFGSSIVLGIWRPRSGALVGRLADAVTWANGAACTVTELGHSIVILSGSVTSQTTQDGDILVCELWRDALTTQSMSSAYTNTVFYDGTIETSATDNAAYILFANDVALSTGGSAIPPGLGPVVSMQQPFISDMSLMR